MPRCPDVSPDTRHPDAAGWVLRALDPPDAAAFGEHLAICDRCQADVASFEAVVQMTARAAPESQPPPELHARTMAALAAAVESDRSHPRPRLSFWRHWNFRLLSIAIPAAVALIALVVFVSLRPSAAPTQLFTIPLHPASGSTASGTAVAHRIDGGFSIRLSVRGLPDLGPGRFYECWYTVGPLSGPGKQLITAGTFTVGPSGRTTVNMTSAADPRSFTIMEITTEQPGDAAQHGRVILSGTAAS